MRHVGVRELKNQATTLLGRGETLLIERRGKPIGFYVPLEAKDRVVGRRAMGRLDRALGSLMKRLDIGEAALLRELGADPKRK